MLVSSLSDIFYTSNQQKSRPKMKTNKRCNIPLILPGCGVGRDFEATRVADKFIKDADDLFKLRPVVPLFLPAVQHQLVEGSRTVHGWGEAVSLIYSLYYLDVRRKRQDLRGRYLIH